MPTTRPIDDEWYTLPEDVARILDPLRPCLDGMTVLCPCDTGASAYVAYLREVVSQVVFADPPDFEAWDFADFDAVITNPPFSRAADIVERALDAGVPFHFLVPRSSLKNRVMLRAVRDGARVFCGGFTPSRFRRPDGTLMGAPCAIVTSWAYPAGVVRHLPCRSGVSPVMTDEGVPRYRAARDVPPASQLSGEVAVPCTFFGTRDDAGDFWPVRRVELHEEGRLLMSSILVRRRA